MPALVSEVLRYDSEIGYTRYDFVLSAGESTILVSCAGARVVYCTPLDSGEWHLLGEDSWLPSIPGLAEDPTSALCGFVRQEVMPHALSILNNSVSPASFSVFVYP